MLKKKDEKWKKNWRKENRKREKMNYGIEDKGKQKGKAEAPLLNSNKDFQRSSEYVDKVDSETAKTPQAGKYMTGMSEDYTRKENTNMIQSIFYLEKNSAHILTAYLFVWNREVRWVPLQRIQIYKGQNYHSGYKETK